jgi:hypothetical protein
MSCPAENFYVRIVAKSSDPKNADIDIHNNNITIDLSTIKTYKITCLSINSLYAKSFKNGEQKITNNDSKGIGKCSITITDVNGDVSTSDDDNNINIPPLDTIKSIYSKCEYINPPSSGNTGMIVGIFIGLVVFIGGGIGAYIYFSSPKINESFNGGIFKIGE